MRMKNRAMGIMLALVLALGMALPGLGEVLVTDGLGREVRIAALPEKVVSLTAANTEILFALGVGDKLVGVDSWSDYPAEAAAIETKVGDYAGPNIEAIVALEPDVVFASTTLQAGTVEQLESLGITVVCNDPTSLAEIPVGIEMIATVMGADAGEINGKIASAIEDSKTKVYFALSFGEFGNYTAGPGTFVDDILALLRCENVAHNSPVSWPEYTMEQLIADDPDVILVSDYAGDGSIVVQLMQEPGYADLRCVKEGKVYAIDANITSRPGPRIAEAIEVIAEALSGK